MPSTSGTESFNLVAGGMSFGINSQLMPVAPNNPTRIGCSTVAPERAARMPVMAGKMEPPTWPRTKTKAVVISIIQLPTSRYQP